MHEFKEHIAYCLDLIQKIDQLVGDGYISASSVDEEGNFTHDEVELEFANATAIGMCHCVEATLAEIRERLLELERNK